MSGIVHQLNIWGDLYILLFLYKWTSSRTDCPVFAWETHDGNLPGSWQMMCRQCLNFKMAKMFGIVDQLDIWGHVYMLLFWYKRSSSEQIDLSSHGKHMMAPYQEVDSWLTYVCRLYIYFTGNSIKCYSFCLIFSIFTQNWKVMVPFTEQSNLRLLTIRMSNKLIKCYMLLYLV